jgi:hypothetical protein
VATTIVMTLDVLEGELDALRPQLLFHQAAGVGGVVLGVGERADVIRDIVRTVELYGHVQLVEGALSAGPLERTRTLAEWAVDGFDANWILPAAPGEFWWPRGTRLDELLQRIPAEYGTVQALVRPFAPVADGDEPFVERMVYRVVSSGPFAGPELAWRRPARRLVYRAGVEIDPDLESAVGRGDSKLRPLRGWYPVEVLSFPHRSAHDPQAADRGDVERGLASGALQLDARVREALRTLEAGGTPDFPRPGIADDAELAADAAVLGEADVLAARRKMDELEQRLAEVEARPVQRVRRKLGSLLGRST